MEKDQAANPTQGRFLKSYQVRRAYSDEIQRPPAVAGVAEAIDIHCHADQGHQDPLALAKHATLNGMGGILFKSIAGDGRSADTVKELREALHRWANGEKLAPIRCEAGYVVRGASGPSLHETREQIAAGAVAVWMPVAMHANTLSKVGGRKVWWDSTASRHQLTPPLPWEEALKVGHYLLDPRGNLQPEIRDIIRFVADAGKSFFFGHATHPEIFAMAEEVEKIGFQRAVVDHPFSPFVDLSVEQMQQFATAGIYLNFTYDEISPLLGVDPFKMYQAIRAVGVERAILSSDAGEPLFPNSVEAMRLIRAYMRAYGLSDGEVRRVSVVNPALILGAA
ncbi:MAG TPA: DUF6282 family protein [Candidatus Binatia bacterium]